LPIQRVVSCRRSFSAGCKRTSSSSGGPGEGGGEGEGSLCIGTSAIRVSAISTSISCESSGVRGGEDDDNDDEVDAFPLPDARRGFLAFPLPLLPLGALPDAAEGRARFEGEGDEGSSSASESTSSAERFREGVERVAGAVVVVEGAEGSLLGPATAFRVCRRGRAR